jgi:hypothetical protein
LHVAKTILVNDEKIAAMEVNNARKKLEDEQKKRDVSVEGQQKINELKSNLISVQKNHQAIIDAIELIKDDINEIEVKIEVERNKDKDNTKVSNIRIIEMSSKKMMKTKLWIKTYSEINSLYRSFVI